ncbi:uncharacterized protein LOC142225777 isoform X2 [Haematobia irritans]|uniref:uncharacterized protein LOC142225777 isoform X2 n=1 Tax=Haematobia irritans TaxID=7368 RepID=UPI003F503A3F
MSEDQDQPRRSSRRTQGIPPAYLNTYIIEMPTEHSPQKDTTGKVSKSQCPPGANTQNVSKNNTPSAKNYPTVTSSPTRENRLPEEWQTFFEAYESTTSEFGYTNLHSIMRLRDSIKGRARETVESLLSHSANVNTIMEILKETYGRPEQLVRSQIEKVRAIPPLANDNLDSIVNFANKISNMTTFLKNAKGEHHLSNPSLLSELVSKLPTNRQMQWAEKSLTLERSATIVDFCEWLSILRRLANIVNDTLPLRPAVVKHPPITLKVANVCKRTLEQNTTIEDMFLLP